MIQLEGINKSYKGRTGIRRVLRNLELTIHPGEKVGILAKNGAGKSTLIRLICGAERPTSGRITRAMSVSWPLAFGGGFQRFLTGRDNLRFICRIYGGDYDEAERFVTEFSELGDYFREPVQAYSAGMRARLAFAISMAIDFDCYLIDEAIAVGDFRFRKKCEEELFEKRSSSAKVIVSHQQKSIRQYCDFVYILEDGALIRFDDIDAAYEYYTASR